MLRITNFNVQFDDESPLESLVAKRLQLPLEAILQVVIVRKAVDARRYKNSPIYFVYVLDVAVKGSEKKILSRLKKERNITIAEKPVSEIIESGSQQLCERPVIVGFGPAGMLAAWQLAQAGYQPLVLERGQDVDTRTQDIQKFWQTGVLNTKSNVQFGEGGAGTFSDGKLTTRISDSKMRDVLELFIECGAPDDIRYLHKPHIGTDRLRVVVKKLRETVVGLGGEIRFGAQVTDIEVKNGRVTAVVVNDDEVIKCQAVLMGIGHSARDTYELLHKRGVEMLAKPFAVGVRIEHPQEWIDKAQYGADAGSQLLPTADYALTFQDREQGRGVYSFCMCPGGQVVAAASENGMVVTNGMSNYQRDSGIANSALLVTVGPADFGSDDVMAGIAFQQKYEALAFEHGGSDYCAPVQTVGDFLNNRTGSSEFLVTPSYKPGVRTANLRKCLPEAVCGSLAVALPQFERKIKGFADNTAVMTGIESRSSAPCRILRDRESFESVSVEGIYPMGEGAGYAGGIMSAAVDGLNTAGAVIKKYQRS